MCSVNKKTFFGVLIPVLLFAAAPAASLRGQVIQSRQAPEDSVILVWLKGLYEEGVTMGTDTITVNAETNRLLRDENYRSVVYPKVYTWEQAVQLIQARDLKKAFWFFLNLYLVNNQNKELVIKSLLLYDRLFKMDKILLNIFYTYIFTDPEIGTITEGESRVQAPQVMEKKLAALKEILGYLDKFRLPGGQERTGEAKLN